MKNYFNFLVSFLLFWTCFTGSYAESHDTPRVGIVISKASYQHRWGVTQMCAHGWAGVVNLAGIPYDCLFISDLTGDRDLTQFDALILGQCAYVSNADYPGLVKALEKYLSEGGSLIVDGPLAVNDGEAEERDHSILDGLLNIRYPGFSGDSEYRIQVADDSHYITRPYDEGQNITQHLVNGLNILTFNENEDVLLISTNGESSYPFLSCCETESGRIVLVSDFSTWAGVPSFFRNADPQVFYANLVYNVLLRAVHWTLYGDVQTPFPVPQVSNADLTAIIRLDADISQNLDAQIKTMNYLTDIARESGVLSVYGWVSSGAVKAGWQDLAPLGKMMEDAGSQIGTHSKHHRINREMNHERWSEELDESIRDIEFNTADYGYPIGKVDFFINPGNTIRMEDYQQVAQRFSFYMTHGFEQDMPIGYGNLTWYTGPYEELVVLEDTPSPDYQWFYDPTWSYTTQQITAYEEAVFDHMIEKIGRGVIFNEMWHDYSITTMAQYGKDRIMNTNNRPFYDAVRAKFATSDIYCPGPVDLGHKLRAMAQWEYSWKSDDDRVEITLDLTAVRNDTVPYFIGGMGISIENTPLVIQKVNINGHDHPAFDHRLIILPNLKKEKNRIIATMGPTSSNVPRLTYISKRMPVINKEGEDISLSVLTESKARMSFYVEKSSVLLNTDYQEWNRKGNRQIRGFVTSDRRVILKKIECQDIHLLYADIIIMDVIENKEGIRFKLKGGKDGESKMCFLSHRDIKKITFQGKDIDYRLLNGKVQLSLPSFQKESDLFIILRK
jgi:uncharacterized membrane protein